MTGGVSRGDEAQPPAAVRSAVNCGSKCRKARIDAHHHIWDTGRHEHRWLLSRPQLRRTYSLTEFGDVARDNGIGGSVLIHTLHSAAETQWLLDQARDHALVRGVVGWIDLEGDSVASRIAELRSSAGGDKLVGVRHLVHNEEDAHFLERQRVISGLQALGAHGLSFDLLVRPREMPSAIRAARAAPGTQFVLDHAGKPDIVSGDTARWSRLIEELASLPNVACKVSGLLTEAGSGWRQADIALYVKRCLDAFTPDRVLFGSDWPVCTLRASYGEALELIETAMSELAAPEREAVMGGNAAHVYQLRRP